MGALDEGSHFGVANGEDGGSIRVEHRAQLEGNLARLIQLAPIGPQSCRVVFVPQIDHFCVLVAFIYKL